MRSRTLIAAVVLASAVVWAADLPLQPFSYAEGFEGDPPAVAL